jgi:hypothetical protein
MAKYTFQQLVDLWVQAGGNAASGAMAAAIAMAESGGDPDATHVNTNGTTDRGLWQINSIHGAQSTTDPTANARAAVAISGNGSSWRPWCTAWSDGACGGDYLGSSSPYRKYTSGDVNTGSVAGSSTQTAGLSMLNPSSWAQAFLKPIGVWLLYGAMAGLGTVLIVAAGWFLMYNSSAMQDVRGSVVGAVTSGRTGLSLGGKGKGKSSGMTKSAGRKGKGVGEGGESVRS